MYFGLKLGTSPKSHDVNNVGLSPVCTEIFTVYPAAKVHIDYISYKLLCGPVAKGFRQRTLASSLGLPQNPTTWTTRDCLIHTKIFTGYPAAKVHAG